MTTLLAIIIAAIFLVVYLTAKFAKWVWNTWVFWVLALAVMVVMFPLTAGMSPMAFIGLLALRLVVLGKIVGTPTPAGR
jgi:hypothetical protein